LGPCSSSSAQELARPRVELMALRQEASVGRDVKLAGVDVVTSGEGQMVPSESAWGTVMVSDRPAMLPELVLVLVLVL
jgi:hypothetical protein